MIHLAAANTLLFFFMLLVGLAALVLFARFGCTA